MRQRRCYHTLAFTKDEHLNHKRLEKHNNATFYVPFLFNDSAKLRCEAKSFRVESVRNQFYSSAVNKCKL